MRAIAYAVVFVALTAVGGLTYLAHNSGQTELLALSPAAASAGANDGTNERPMNAASDGTTTGRSETGHPVDANSALASGAVANHAVANNAVAAERPSVATANDDAVEAANATAPQPEIASSDSGTSNTPGVPPDAAVPVKRISQDGRIRLTPLQLASSPSVSDATLLESLVQMVPEPDSTPEPSVETIASGDRDGLPTDVPMGQGRAAGFAGGPSRPSTVSEGDLQTLQQAIQQISSSQTGAPATGRSTIRSGANSGLASTASIAGTGGTPGAARSSGGGGGTGGGGGAGGGGLPSGRGAAAATAPTTVATPTAATSPGSVLQALENSVAGPSGSLASVAVTNTAGASAAGNLVAASDPSKFGIPNAQFWAFDFTAGTNDNGDMNGDGIIDAADARIQFDAYLTYLQSELDSDEHLQVVRNSVDDLSQIFDEFNDEAATKQDPDPNDAVSENFVSYMIIEFDTKGFYLPDNAAFQQQVADSNAWLFEANPDPGLNP